MKQAEIDELKARVAALERQVAQLQASNGSPPVTDWRSTMGMFGDDPIMKAAFDEALKIREADRRRARQRFAKADRGKKARRRKAATSESAR